MRIDRLSADDVLDGFRLIEKIHQGGMAVIWSVESAEGEGPGFPLAMKLPRFVRNGDFSKQPYIVMERMQGQSLFRKHEGKAPLPIATVADIGIRTAEALDALHRQNVVHLDLKPANLFEREDGTIAFLDFGLSHSELLPDLLAEEFRLPLGTGAYMAPEQVLGVRNDRRSDLFALGVMLYELATGAMPFGVPTTWKGMRRRLWRDPEPPRARRPDLPDWLQEIILKLLNVSPGQRFASAAQLAFALRNPTSIPLTAYGQRTRQDGFMTVLRRRLRARKLDFSAEAAGTGGLATAPIVAVAVDLAHEPGPLEEAVARAARRVTASEPDARIACLSVLRTRTIGVDFATNDAGESFRLLRLVALRDWSRRLGFPAGRLTHHVLEGSDPAEELIGFCRNNHVEHLVMGARGASVVRRYLGSVSAQVVAEAPCSVTVVRVAGEAGDGESPVKAA
jgi:eukaryotic-like serine/threonine-protein kinase